MKGPANSRFLAGARAVQLGGFLRSEEIFDECVAPIVDVANQETGRDPEGFHSLDVFVMKDAAMLDPGSASARVEAQGVRPFVGVEDAIDGRIPVGVHADRPALTQALLHRLIEFVGLDIGNSLFVGVEEGVALEPGSTLVRSVAHDLPARHADPFVPVSPGDFGFIPLLRDGVSEGVAKPRSHPVALPERPVKIEFPGALEESGALVAEGRDPHPVGAPENLQAGLGHVLAAKEGVVARDQRHGGARLENSVGLAVGVLHDFRARRDFRLRGDACDFQGLRIAIRQVERCVVDKDRMFGAGLVEHGPGEGIGSLLEGGVELSAHHPLAFGGRVRHGLQVVDGFGDGFEAEGADILERVQEGEWGQVHVGLDETGHHELTIEIDFRNIFSRLRFLRRLSDPGDFSISNKE